MNIKRDNDNGISSTHSPYVEWDETIELPSRKERFPSRKQKNKPKTKAKTQLQEMHEDTDLPPKQDLEDAALHKQHEQVAATIEALPSPIPVQERKQSLPLTKEQLRRRRKRYVKLMRLLRFVRRILIGIASFVVLLLVVFWWKFVYVYDIPDYLQQQNPNVKAYIAWKPWTFGPPILDLRANGNPHTQNEIESYLIRMDAYKEVIVNPFIIWRFKE